MQTWAAISHTVTKNQLVAIPDLLLTESLVTMVCAAKSLRCKAGGDGNGLRRPSLVRDVGSMRCGAGHSPHV